jgi:hypothetical protein
MFSSGGRAAALSHHTRTVTHRVDCDNQSALNALRTEGRGNRLADSPYKHATPAHSNSKSRQKKLSANKLFAKAHQAHGGETYLTHSKSSEPYHARPLRSSGHCSDCTHSKKAKALEVHQEFNIRIGGEAEGNTLSLIIEQYGFCGLCIEGLSSIQENGDDSTITSANTSLIELIAKS